MHITIFDWSDNPNQNKIAAAVVFDQKRPNENLANCYTTTDNPLDFHSWDCSILMEEHPNVDEFKLKNNLVQMARMAMEIKKLAQNDRTRTKAV